MIIIGYSGHALVALDILLLKGKKIEGYCENEKKSFNPFKLTYFGEETSESGLQAIGEHGYFIGIGDNEIRKKIQTLLTNTHQISLPANAIHPSSILAKSAKLGSGVMIAANAVINPFAQVGDGVILNTSSVIEHECTIGDFSHVAPGATLAGNVTIGDSCFIGANSVIKQGIAVGSNVVIGAGTVIIRDVPENTVLVGNPGRIIS